MTIQDAVRIFEIAHAGKESVGSIGSYDCSKWRSDYLIGAGVEHTLTDNVSLKAEYNYVRFSQDKISGAKTDLTNHILKADVNYHL